MKETKGDITEYSQYFGDETMRMMKVLAGADGKKLDSFLAIQGDGTAVIQDSARAARTATAAMQNLKSAWMSFADQQLAGPISALADAVNSINPETLNAALTGATALAGALGAAWAGRKIWTAGKSIAGFFRGNDQTTEHNPLSGDNQVMKVFVTNMPGRGDLVVIGPVPAGDAAAIVGETEAAEIDIDVSGICRVLNETDAAEDGPDVVAQAHGDG
ncbi:hypothetical protein P4S72_27080 [Vibrio sp. PP-XX7]